ncbi:MAG: AAA family ATPase [Eubacteriales bacterium]
MDKKLYLIGGTMGIGKTTVSRILKSRLDRSVMLDGDWCWDMNPFTVNDETKAMVMDNICYLLNNFIKCSAYDNIIFCWVMHEQAIIDEILSRLDKSCCNVIPISLVCAENELRRRIQRDIDEGKRTPDVLERSTARIGMYEKLNTCRLDVTDLTPEETAEKIISL